MIDHRLERSATWRQQSIKIRLAQDWGPRSLIKRQRLRFQYVSLHLRQVHIVVKLDDVNLPRVFRIRVEWHFNKDPGDTVIQRKIDLETARFHQTLLVYLLVSVDDVLKLDAFEVW